MLILFFPYIGGIAWLVAGRPLRSGNAPGRRPGGGFPEYGKQRSAPKGPDDDEAFLQEMRKIDQEQEQTLKRWEEDLRRREEDLRRRDTED